ncbi:MAG: dTDP-glucose 4,6-dehydratase [Spirochaetia bacterium]|nr:dTDP-glucose 4,6-dehydratase [Spirochaetia bacterium]
MEKYQEVIIINVDSLTYAGNLENLASVMNDNRHLFIQGDICDKEIIEKIFQDYDVDYVVNFAAESHVDRSITNPDVFAQTNVIGTLNLLNAAKKAWLIGEDTYKEGVKFQQVSTDEVYGSLGSKGFFTETTPLDPHSPYSSSKASADLFVKAYADTYKLPVNITRCSNNYGPYQFPEKLIPLMINNCLNHKALPVYGDGMQIRDWLYVEDHCKAIDLVLSKGRAGEVYNVGGQNEMPNIAIVKNIINYVSKHVDGKVNEGLIKHITDRKGHDRRYGIDPKKIKDELGWKPETVFEDGIQLTIQWYLENKEWMSHITSGSYQQYYEQMYSNR